MSINYANKTFHEIEKLISYYEKNERFVTVEDVCNHVINREIDIDTALEMLSYFYGVHENDAVYGYNASVKRRAHTLMNKFDYAVNEIEYDFESQIYRLANRIYTFEPSEEHCGHARGGSPLKYVPSEHYSGSDSDCDSDCDSYYNFYTPERPIQRLQTPPPIIRKMNVTIYNH
jgi:hypothetical protein